MSFVEADESLLLAKVILDTNRDKVNLYKFNENFRYNIARE